MSGLSLRINTWNVGRTHVTLWVFCLIGDDHCRRDHSPGYGFLALSDDAQFCVYHGGLAGPPFPKCLQRSALEALHQPRCHTGPPQRAELRLLPTAWLGGSVVLPQVGTPTTSCPLTCHQPSDAVTGPGRQVPAPDTSSGNTLPFPALTCHWIRTEEVVCGVTEMKLGGSPRPVIQERRK